MARGGSTSTGMMLVTILSSLVTLIAAQSTPPSHSANSLPTWDDLRDLFNLLEQLAPDYRFLLDRTGSSRPQSYQCGTLPEDQPGPSNARPLVDPHLLSLHWIEMQSLMKIYSHQNRHTADLLTRLGVVDNSVRPQVEQEQMSRCFSRPERQREDGGDTFLRVLKILLDQQNLLKKFKEFSHVLIQMRCEMDHNIPEGSKPHATFGRFSDRDLWIINSYLQQLNVMLRNFNKTVQDMIEEIIERFSMQSS